MTFLDYLHKYLLFSSIDTIVFDFLHFVLCIVLIRLFWIIGTKKTKK